MVSWQVPPTEPVSPALLQAVGGHPLLARLLAARGIDDPPTAQAFLDPGRYQPASPYELPGMHDLIAVLQEAISGGKHVRIWGDLDTDGQTATAVLYEALTAAKADVDYRLPTRSQGHGLPLAAVQQALADGVDLLITCDTGVTDVGSVTWAVEHGLQVLITDHHDQPDELPPALAIVNSKALPGDHPLATLAGVGVAYKVAEALLGGVQAATLEAMLDLVAVGQIVDMVDEVADVRYLIQRGLERLQRQPRVGLQALAKIAGVALGHADERDVQFQLGPRINAAGRLGNAQQFIEMLLTGDMTRATELAGALESLNQDRRAHTEALRGQIEQRLAQEPEALRHPAIILQGEDWPAGVLGGVAGDLARVYERPVILIAHHAGRDSTASARSVAGIDIHQAIASQAALLRRQGGHPMAAGFSAAPEQVDQVVGGIQDHLAALPSQTLERTLVLDAVLDWTTVSLALADQVGRLRPFGPGNALPTFLLQQVQVERIEPLGRMAPSPHQRIHLSDGGDRRLAMVWFRAGELPGLGERIDLAFHMDVSTRGGRRRLDLQIADWRPATKDSEQEHLLFDDFETVDWRRRAGRGVLIEDLRARYGDDLWLWVEGDGAAGPAASSRAQRSGLPCVALAIGTSPASPGILRDVLAIAAPQVVYLLPVPEGEALSTRRVLALAAGLARAAIERHAGVLDYARAEEATGLPTHALRLAIDLLVERGTLVREAGCLSPGSAQAAPPRNPDAVQQAMSRLSHVLREVAAYRRAFASLPAPILLADG